MGEAVIHHIRSATYRDIPKLVELEQHRWGRLAGTPPLDFTKLTSWLNVTSSYFLVAEKADGTIDGYYYGIRIHFTVDELSLSKFTDGTTMETIGEAAFEPDEMGNCFYGVNITSRESSAAHLLHTSVLNMVRSSRLQYFVGIARLGTFAHYFRSVLAHHPKELENSIEIATWYATESMRLLGLPGEVVTYPTTLPPLRRPDTILAHHVKGLPAKVLCVVPYIIGDVQSCGLGAVLLSEYPHTV